MKKYSAFAFWLRLPLGRSPLLGVCILRGCESTVLRGSVESRGIQSIQCALYGKLPLFPPRETGNPKINMAEADLSPTTFTSSSASDSDYDISLRIPLKIHTETSSDNYHQTQKAMQSLKSAGVQRCQIRSTGSSCHPVELISVQTTENNSQEMAACLFSGKRRSREHEQELREELL